MPKYKSTLKDEPSSLGEVEQEEERMDLDCLQSVLNHEKEPHVSFSNIQGAPRAPSLQKQPVEIWAELQGTEPWLLAAVQAHQGWAVGTEVSQAEYEQAVTAVLGARLQ